jgi:hypothetical protein
MRASATFQLPPAGSDAAGLEGYSVESPDGEFVGTVRVVLEHGGETYVAVELGRPPVSNDLRAVPWQRVADVDHDALLVRIGRADVEGGLELDAGNAVEGGEAEAHRVTDVPAGARPAPAATFAAPGPVDRPSWYAALALGLAGLCATLGLVVFATTSDFGWEWVLFVLPAGLLAAAAVAGYRFFRRSSQRP